MCVGKGNNKDRQVNQTQNIMQTGRHTKTIKQDTDSAPARHLHENGEGQNGVREVDRKRMDRRRE